MQLNAIVERLATNAFSLLVVSDAGEVVDLVDLDRKPTADELLRFGDQYRGRAGFQCLSKRRLSEAELAAKIADIADALRWARTHELKPGVNIPPKAN